MKHFTLLIVLLMTGCMPQSITHTQSYVIRSELEKSFNEAIIHQIVGGIDNPSNWLTYIDDKSKFNLSYPANYPENKPVFLKEMHLMRDTKCPNLGITEPSKISIGNDSAIWGRADYWDKSNTYEIEVKPVCFPLYPRGLKREYVECERVDYDANNCWKKDRDYEIAHGMYSAYAFCAEKDGKAVAICIQQMTDDEALAKSIFESFRWTE